MIKSSNVYYETEDHRCFAVTNKGIFTFKEPPSKELLSYLEYEYGLTDYEKLDEFTCIYTLPYNPIIIMNLINNILTANNRFDLDMTENDRMQLIPLIDKKPLFISYLSKNPVTPWYLDSKYEHPSYDKNSSLNCDEAWKALGSSGNNDVVIGVVDVGFNLNHPQSQYEGYMYFSGSRIISSLDPSGKKIKLLHLIH